jgi:hypothetical protein
MNLRASPAVVPDVLPGVPTGMVDRAGRVLAPGSAVLVRSGEHVGRLGEVVGWGGRRGVEVILGGAPPAFLALPSPLLEHVDVALFDPIVPRRRSAPAGATRQAADGGAGEPQTDGTIPHGAGGGAVARRHHQNPGLGRLARPEGGLQASSAQALQIAPER